MIKHVVVKVVSALVQLGDVTIVASYELRWQVVMAGLFVLGILTAKKR
jgi:hypothetical protein